MASLVLPGAGQLLVGRRRRGIFLLGVVAAATAAVAWVASLGAVRAVELLVAPRALLVLLFGNLLLLGFRLFATLDAYIVGARPHAQPPAPRSRIAAVGTATALLLLGGAVVAPHALAGFYAVRAQELLDAVFLAESPPEPDLTAAPEPGADAVDPDDPNGTVGPPVDPSDALPDDLPDAPAPEPIPVPAEQPTGNPWLDQERLTFALLGSDAGPGRWAGRIDTMLVVTVGAETGDAAIFSIDRYLKDFPLPDRLAEVYAAHCPYGDGWEYLNALYTCGDQRIPDEFAALYPDHEDPAAAAVAEVLGELLGLPVHHHALVDMAGFVKVIDAFGGVEVDIASAFRVRMSPAEEGGEWQLHDIPDGVQQLDGEEALAFVRQRSATGDADRMRRQRCLITSVAARAEPTTVLFRFPQIARAIEDHAATDIPLDRLPGLVDLLGIVDIDRVVTVGLGPPTYRGADHRPDVGLIQDRVQQVLADPDAALEADRTAEQGTAVCG